MASSISNRTKVFISYSHKDAKYLDGLLPHLKYLERDKLIDFWADTKINPGERWQDEVELALASTRVAILLISIDFLISPFISANELPRLLAAAEADGVKILPVILRHCTLPESLSQFEAINSPSKPLSMMKGYEREALWVKVVGAIESALPPQTSEARHYIHTSKEESVPNQHNREVVKSESYWADFTNVERELKFFVQVYGTPGIMPTEEDLKISNRDDLKSSIARHGGYAVVAQRLGLQARSFEQRMENDVSPSGETSKTLANSSEDLRIEDFPLNTQHDRKAAHIETKQYNIKEIFSDPFVFSIPRYQPPYAWTTEESGQLLEDLLAAMGESTQDPQEASPYFLGSIVLTKGDKSDFEVIDGQQRLATITILLAVLRASIRPEKARGLEKLLYEEANAFTRTRNRYRLTLRKRDAEFFQKYIQSENGIRESKRIKYPEKEREHRKS